MLRNVLHVARNPLIAAVTAAGVGAAVATVVIGRPDIGAIATSSTAANWASAAGTVFAAVVAIAVAGMSQRWLIEEKKGRERRSATITVGYFNEAIASLQAAHEFLEPLRSLPNLPQKQRMQVVAFSQLPSDGFNLSNHTWNLADLPPVAAVSASVAGAELRAFQNMERDRKILAHQDFDRLCERTAEMARKLETHGRRVADLVWKGVPAPWENP